MKNEVNRFGEGRKLLCLRADKGNALSAINPTLVYPQVPRVSISASRADETLFYPHTNRYTFN